MSGSANGGRAVHIFTLPDVVASGAGFTEIGIVELSGEEELMATRRSQGDQIRLAAELTKQSIAKVDGKPVSSADASLDRVWESLGPVGRRLITQAYVQTNAPLEKDAESFTKSRRVEVA